LLHAFVSFFLSSSSPPPDLHSFPTRRSSDLELEYGGGAQPGHHDQVGAADAGHHLAVAAAPDALGAGGRWHLPGQPAADLHGRRDRKSTRLNSSHVSISYAVFCLKKKK